MAIKIAGRKVNIGDRLYHSKMGWGVVQRYDSSGPAVLVVNLVPYGERKLYVRNGGLVEDQRVIFWHEPLKLDYPSADISLIQEIVDVLVPKLAPPPVTEADSE